jgi:hypothetical protein
MWLNIQQLRILSTEYVNTGLDRNSRETRHTLMCGAQNIRRSNNIKVTNKSFVNAEEFK